MKKDLINLSDEIYFELTENELEERFEFVKCGGGFSIGPCTTKIECNEGFSCAKGLNCTDDAFTIR